MRKINNVDIKSTIKIAEVEKGRKFLVKKKIDKGHLKRFDISL